MTRPKISIIGAGGVGSTAAELIAGRELGDVVLLDIIEGFPQGKALDILQSLPAKNSDSDVIGTNNYEDTKDSDIVVITAGIPRKPGMSRDDLLSTNTKIVKEAAGKAAKFSPNAILIVVTNPLDAMVYVAAEASKLPKSKVLGMAGALDSARFRIFIAKKLNVSVKDVQAMVMGGHGDSMVPLPRFCTVSGTPVTDYLSKDKMDAIIERTKKAGGEIISLLKTGSTIYAPSASVVEMVESIVKDKKRVFSCATYCDKEYNVGGYFVGVPVKLGKNGAEEIIELKLTGEEKEMFINSVGHVKELAEAAKKFL